MNTYEYTDRQTNSLRIAKLNEKLEEMNVSINIIQYQ